MENNIISTESVLTEAERLDLLKPNPGVDHGEEVFDIADNPTGEIMVHEYDKDGNISGWHKEVKGGE
jgi:hypothetical protein